MNSNNQTIFAAFGSVTRELLVGASGVVLVLFVAGHLAGNFFIFGGAEVYNSYAAHLHSLGALLWVARIGLIAAFACHVGLTAWLAIENRTARSTRYAVRLNSGGTNLAKRTMLYTGIMLAAFIVLHLFDFTIGDHTGARSIIASFDPDRSLGLYGVVWNSFANPVHSLLYVLALCAVGLHTSNAISTVWVTFGTLTETATSKTKLAAQIAGAVVALAFSSIPIYILAETYVRTF